MKYRKILFLRRHEQERINQIRIELAEAGLHHLLVLGDSHAECLKLVSSDKNLINGGIIGSTASSCLKNLQSITRISKIHSSLLIIGTNDIAKRNPLSTNRVNRFVRDVRSIVKILKALSSEVMISPLPPVPFDKSSLREGLASEVYSNELKIICIKDDCTFIDLFAFMREDRFGISSSKWFTDGLHLKDYNQIDRQIDALLKNIPSAP